MKTKTPNARAGILTMQMNGRGVASALFLLLALFLVVTPGCNVGKGGGGKNPVSPEEACLSYGGGNEIGRWREIKKPQYEDEYKDGRLYKFIQGRLSSNTLYTKEGSMIKLNYGDRGTYYHCFEQRGNWMRTGTPDIGDIEWERV